MNGGTQISQIAQIDTNNFATLNFNLCKFMSFVKFVF